MLVVAFGLSLVAGVAVGTAIGRVLPAIIVTVVIGYVALAGVDYINDRLIVSEAVWRDEPRGAVVDPASGDRLLLQRFRLPDGWLVDGDTAITLDPPPVDSTGWGGPRFPVVALVVPGERYPFAVMREATVLAVCDVAVLAIAAAMVRRRRPG